MHDQAASDQRPMDPRSFFQRFAQLVPVGIAILDHDAKAVFVNQYFHDLTTHNGQDQTFTAWPQSIHPDDHDHVMSAFRQALKSQQQLRIEFRTGGQPDRWRLLLLSPLRDETLQEMSLREYGGFICSLVDITAEKVAELSERQAAQEARQRKEQQERFMDMISHEVRNPLSSMLHCTEDIRMATCKLKGADVDIASIEEAVSIINLCIDHQRSIVDDVLSFSKLDSKLLSLAPCVVRPSERLKNALKIFQPEIRQHNIKFRYEVDDSYMEQGITWVAADMTRVQQVLINLTTNSIKFTAQVQNRERILTVRCGASQHRPPSFPPDAVFFENEDPSSEPDAITSSECGNGDVVYIMVAVTDNGIGINKKDQTRLFERFRQATPKTAEVYGGSGLGLNISRMICQLHGGDISFSSQAGRGSTFSFFVKVKKADAPRDDSLIQQQHCQDAKFIEDHVKEKQKKLSKGVVPTTQSSPLAVRPAPRPDEEGKTWTGQDGHGCQRVVTESVDSIDSGSPAAEVIGSDLDSIKASQIRRQNVEDCQNHNSGLHVLLVEDNIINQRVVLKKLVATGFVVTTANNGHEAVTAVERHRNGSRCSFDVILMDQEMPSMDGNAATKAIRDMEARDKLAYIPILGVTANAREEKYREMRNSGADDVMYKPYRIQDMIERIHQLIKASG